MPNFDQFSTLSSSLLQATAALGFTTATPIQQLALPPMLEGRDVVAQAQTGSGKTAAFGLALLQRLQPAQVSLQGLILCPTRELADQVSKELRVLARFIPNVKILTLCGGVPLHIHLASLTHVPHIVVGTPGRVLDLCEKGALRFDSLHSVVLDEADRMLDMGFLDAVSSILALTPQTRCTWLFSATYPPDIAALSSRFQREAVNVKVASNHDSSSIEQRFHRVAAAERQEAVLAVLLQQQPEACLVFSNTRQEVRELSDFLWKRGLPALALHGELEQRERDETLLQFANGSCRVLVATDVAARGLDIKALPLVISAQLPNDSEVYTHRIGRTGRAGHRGMAVSLVAEEDESRLQRLTALPGDGTVPWQPLPARAGQSALAAPPMRTLLIEAGRQDKLRPGDIVGALTGAGGMANADIGKIEVFPTRAYVAVARNSDKTLPERLRSAGIKGRRFRVRWL
jgi:ATP-independent RNA helicase DbpA